MKPWVSKLNTSHMMKLSISKLKTSCKMMQDEAVSLYVEDFMQDEVVNL